jgi:putative hydrolase of the HAD superfamily
MLKTYKHIFFDLDNTLWDYDGNSAEVISDLLKKYNLQDKIVDPDEFVKVYQEINTDLWNQYRKGILKKEILRTERFLTALGKFGIHDFSLAEKIGIEYLDISPTKTKLFEHTSEVLKYLKRKYRLYILSNGFTDTQNKKMKLAGIFGFFDYVFTSEKTGSSKPSPGIFRYALEYVSATPKDSLMIGDELEIDILGARDCGMDQVYFNPSRKPHKEKITFEIVSLAELMKIL